MALTLFGVANWLSRAFPAQHTRPRQQGQRQMVLAAINTAFTQESFETASAQWRAVADQVRAKFPNLAELMDQAEADVLAFMSPPRPIQEPSANQAPSQRPLQEYRRGERLLVSRPFVADC